MGGDQSPIKTMRKQMTTAELGYQQKELEMLIDILKRRLKGDEYPDRPGFNLDGLPSTILKLVKEIEDKALFYEKIIKAYYSGEKFIYINTTNKSVYINTDIDKELGCENPNTIIRLRTKKPINCGWDPINNPGDIEIDRCITINGLIDKI